MIFFPLRLFYNGLAQKKMYAMKPVKLTPSASKVKHADVKGSLVGKNIMIKAKGLRIIKGGNITWLKYVKN